MTRAVVYAFLATAFVFLMVCLPIINKRGHNIRLSQNRRLGYTFLIPNFDPLVVKMERLAEEKDLSNESNFDNSKKNSNNFEAEDYADGEYISDDGKLNITLRLTTLFQLIDKAPKDGRINFEELQTWNREQAVERLMYKTQKEMDLHDKDGDEEISFTEYFPQFSREEIERKDMGHGEAGWWMEQFRNADVDGDGTLNLDELNNFLHPEDSSNKEIQKWLLRDRIRWMDDDQDGKISFAEFQMYVYNIYKAYAGFETDVTNLPTAKQKFQKLDTDENLFLDVDELIPFLHYLKPGELSYATYYASYLIQEADDDGDRHLSLDEMINHENTFYTTVFHDRNEDHDDFFDEL
ncbi:hypothetical protein JCGZ_08570 [Jatropha curcas]|uniref:EF-hand domain-containing protein n=1 Tax=Jatropha curcas TaxID=180498 RepID=A0A067KYP3_JATCU|nr:reticulocalbin-2 [Jatropha curcas]KDP37385.1 hypothetical protein JCGZ_08570 [Jatropha curcas]